MSPRELHRAAEARLAEREQRYTANRRRIVEALAEASSPQTLPQLLHRRPNLTQSSTYRNLAALEDAQVVRRIVSGSEHAHYELAEHLTEHHHHLVCVGCGAIIDVTLEAPLEARLEQAFDVAAEVRGFRPAGHSIDIYGHCADCARPEDRSVVWNPAFGPMPNDSWAQNAVIRATTASVAKIPAATRRRMRSGRTRSSARPASTPIPATVIIAAVAPMNTESASPPDARLAVASCVRSPHSARNTTPNTVAEIRHAGNGGPATVARFASASSSSSSSLDRHSTTAPTPNSTATASAHRPVGEQAEQAPGGDGDDHLGGQGDGGADPHRQRALEPGRQHDRGQHRLVRQLGDEDRGERGGDGRRVHGRQSTGRLTAERSAAASNVTLTPRVTSAGCASAGRSSR